MTENFKSGIVNIIGLPNSGKSTLLNSIIGQKLSAVTPKAQTTRHRIKGILTDDSSQIIFFDTPGLIQPAYLLQERMMKIVQEALSDTDLNLLVVDASATNQNYTLIDSFLINSKKPLLIAINKIDLLTREQNDSCTAFWHDKYPESEIVQISALLQIHLDTLLARIRHLLPVHPPYFDTEEITDRPMRFFIQELIREQILLMYHEEIPYAVHVVVEEYKEKETITVIKASIYVERDSQKGIILGHKGSSIRELGTRCRQQIELFIQQKVFLELTVKVRKDWRNNDEDLNRWGYKQ